MAEFFVERWGDLSSVAGFIFAIAGLVWAGIQSKKARSSAEAAEEATIETRNAIGRHLLIIDLQQSISLIQQLKFLHRDGHWRVSLAHYQTLREMISAIVHQSKQSESELRERLLEATASITVMERQVEAWVVHGAASIDAVELNRQLNDIQSDLEKLSNLMELAS